MASGTTFRAGFTAIALVVLSVAASNLIAQQARPQTAKPTPSPTSQTAHTAKLAAPDAAFLKKAAADGVAEVALADLAQSKASNADVQALAAKIKEDHTKANAELKALAAAKNVQVSETPDKQHAMTKDRFAKMDGKTFDRSYVNEMVTDHRKAVAEFTAKTKSTDADVKGFAEKTLPALKDHLAKAEALQKSMK